MQTKINFTKDQLIDAIDWLDELNMEGVDIDFLCELDPSIIISSINQLYEGGAIAFIESLEY